MLQIFFTFFKIALFTFGGGYAMIPLIQKEVTGRGWMELEELVEFIAISESTPGPFAVNIATFVGMEHGGLLMAAMATLGAILPSFLIILIISKFFFASFRDNRYVQAAFTGLRPVIIGLILAATYSIAKTALIAASADGGAVLNWRSLVIIAVVFTVSRLRKKVHPILLIVISACMGMVLYGFLPA